LSEAGVVVVTGVVVASGVSVEGGPPPSSEPMQAAQNANASRSIIRAVSDLVFIDHPWSLGYFILSTCPRRLWSARVNYPGRLRCRGAYVGIFISIGRKLPSILMRG
jgi:hypothetical protein